MPSPRKKRVSVKVCVPLSAPVLPAEEKLVIVVGPEPACAESFARGFATQGEAMRVMWFAQACQALASGIQKALAGVIVCHRPEQAPDAELGVLRRAWPDTPVLAWQLG